jgi:hypothetical protein
MTVKRTAIANRLARALAIVWIALLAQGCASDEHIDFHVISAMKGAIPQVAGACRSEDTETFAYRYPNGRLAERVASSTPSFSLRLTSERLLRLVRLDRPDLLGHSIVGAFLVVEPDDVVTFDERRREFVWCDLLVVVNGNAVGIIHSGVNGWDGGIPVGSFSSYDAAEAVYRASGIEMRREVQPAHESSGDAKIAAWLESRDTWEFYCSPGLKEDLEKRNPKAFEAMMKRSKPDCGESPVHER